MTDMTFFCPKCGKNLKIDETASGMKVNCPECGQAITVPQQYGGQSSPVPRGKAAKPAFIVVFGVMNIIFGALGLLCMGFVFITAVAVAAVDDSSRELPGLLKGWLFLASFIGLLLSIWLLTLGIGLLNYKQWARTGSIAYAWVAIALFVLNVMVQIATLAGSSRYVVDEAISQIALSFIFGLVWLAYLIVLLVFMNKTEAAQACSD